MRYPLHITVMCHVGPQPQTFALLLAEADPTPMIVNVNPSVIHLAFGRKEIN